MDQLVEVPFKFLASPDALCHNTWKLGILAESSAASRKSHLSLVLGNLLLSGLV